MLEQIENVVLHETTRARYLNYAMSVITARALPDIRDGLKPVQRRILYGMYDGLRLLPDAKPKKSAAVVGEVMAKYHPHGDQSIYDAMVRMAQSFSLRYPLVEGQGNFGSLDGDPAAAMRYTEARLRHLAVEMLAELRKQTVEYRPNYDGSLFEPEVLPAQVPNLLINGAAGIAVGMATQIPPHNLGEIVDACVALIDNPSITLGELVGPIVKGPDFPTGPSILVTRDELLEVYGTGQGPITMRSDYHMEGRSCIVIESLPYTANKASLISDIAEHIRAERVPQLVDVRDESTDDIRIVLELKRGADHEAAMAFLFKHTNLESRFNCNMNALVPSEEPGGACQPQRVGLLDILDEFLKFRLLVTRRRLEYDLAQLERRIHLLEAYIAIFDALDEAIALIRQSKDKSSAREALMLRFSLDHDQSEAILETKLYRLARLEIDSIREELAEKEAEAAALRQTLGADERLWALIRSELVDLREAYGDRRKCKVSVPVDDLEYNPEDYIVAEDAFVMISRQGRFKRQKSYTELSAVRVREGDDIGWVLPASTTETLVLFTDRGSAYSLRVADVPATTGYGEAVQTRFDFADGEQIVGAVTTDPRTLPELSPEAIEAAGEDAAPPPWVVAVSRGGRTLRCSLHTYAEPSTRNGRLYMRLNNKMTIDGVVAVYMSDGTEVVSLASQQGRVLLFDVNEAKVLNGPGKGVMAIKLARDDYVLGFELSRDKMEGVEVETNRGRVEVVRPNKYQITKRGNRGRELIKMGHLKKVYHKPIELEFPQPQHDETVDETVDEAYESEAAVRSEDEPFEDGADPSENGSVHPGQGSLFDLEDDD